MPQAGYVWTDPRVSLHLKPDVVTRLCRDASEAFESIPRRVLEIGGILLGEMEDRHGAAEIRITDYQPVECEHRWGPAYRLSEQDVERLDRAVQEQPGVVGIYRTQASLESLTLQDHDAQLFHRYFSRCEGVVLLVGPPAGRCAAFLPHHGIAHEFKSEDASAAATPVRPWAVARKKQFWPAVAAVALGSILGAAAMARFETRPARSHIAAAPMRGANSRLQLQIQKADGGLELRWDPVNNVVRAATYAQLQITDGTHISRLKLTPTMLTAGMFQYWPQTQAVGFRMDLFNTSGKISDSADAGVAPAGKPPAAAPGPVSGAPVAKPAASTADRRVEEDDVKPSPFATVPPQRPPKRAAPPPKRLPAQQPEPIVALSTTPTIEPKSALETPPPLTAPLAKPAPVAKTTPPVRTAAEDRPAVAPARRSAPHVTVNAEPLANSSRFGRAMSHIPLLRRLKKQPQAFVPPKPVREVKPALSERETAWLVRPIPVDVKVYVSEKGKVEFAEVLTDGRRPELASEAVYAARKWTFTPARVGDEAVPGEVILHFRFAPVE